MTKKLLLTNESLGTQRWALLENNPAISTDKTTKVTIAKNAANTLFRIIPGITNSTAGDFQAIGSVKNGWTEDYSTIGYSQLEGTSSPQRLSSSCKRIGQRLFYSGKVKGIKVDLRFGGGSVTGLVYARIRRVSDDLILAESEGFNISSLTTTAWSNIYFALPETTINEEVRFNIEYNGSSSWGVEVRTSISNVSNGMYTYSNAIEGLSYIDNANSDLSLQVIENMPCPARVIINGNWTFNNKIEQDTSYAYTIRLGARISKSTNSDGSNATEIATIESSNNIALTATIGSQYVDSWTWNAPQIDLAENEYLFVEYRARIVTSASNNAARFSFVTDEEEQFIETPQWTTLGGEPPPQDEQKSSADTQSLTLNENQILSTNNASNDNGLLSFLETFNLEKQDQPPEGESKFSDDVTLLSISELQNLTNTNSILDSQSIFAIENATVNIFISAPILQAQQVGNSIRLTWNIPTEVI